MEEKQNGVINVKYVFSKETEGYRVNEEDFANGTELTVTITLHEYRDLVSDNMRYSRYIVEKDHEIKQLKEKLEAIEKIGKQLKEVTA